MTIDPTRLPTHLSHVARRLNVCNPDDLATRFLETSYLVEAFLKSLAITLQVGIRKSAREIAYRHAHALVRADGLGTWEQCIREIGTQPTAGYLSAEFTALLGWLSKKRTKEDDEWFRTAYGKIAVILELLGTDIQGAGKAPITAKEMIGCLVQIRNKTKAHGAVGESFYVAANSPYWEAVTEFVLSCPIINWRWVHLLQRESGKLRGVVLSGLDTRHLRDAELEHLSIDSAGVHFIPQGSTRAFYCGDLLLADRECTTFSLPNGGLSGSGKCEFIDYGSGRTTKESAEAFSAIPTPLPLSETEGLQSFDVQSNTFGNLPALLPGYIPRAKLEGDLSARLLDRNHHIITLHGGGGMGKTSLALAVAHQFSGQASPPFDHIVWFSARDIDLRPTGPVEVQPTVIDLPSISKRFGQLFADLGGQGNTVEALAKALESPEGISDKGILFIFDNFETMAEVRGLHRFLDEHTHLPNKVLITSRERGFVADYPIEVKGMERGEAEQMLIQTARDLNIEPLMTPEVMDRIYSYTDGHAYVMKVVVGEMAKDGRYSAPAQVIGRRQDIVDAVFSRSFNKLSDAGRFVFLLVGNWKSNVPELALIVVLGVRGVDALSGVEECRRLSLIERSESPDGTYFYFSPALARSFAHKKLTGDPDRLVIQQDLNTLQKFGASPMTNDGQTESRLIEQFITSCFADAREDSSTIEISDKRLECLANSWPPAWRRLAQFRKETGATSDAVEEALRRAVEEEPNSKDAWLERAEYARQCGKEDIEISSLVSAAECDPANADLLKEVSFQVCRYVNAHISEIPPTRRGVYLASVRSHMQKIATKLNAVGLSRLAWLFLLEENVEQARKYAEQGCALDPSNNYCLKILERLERDTYDPFNF